jgi:putative adenylate-forming enzyme
LHELRQHRRFLLKNSPYFKDLPQINNLNDISKWPQMDKQTMMSNFDKMSTVNLKSKDALQLALTSERSREFGSKYHGLSVGLSSGTSGHRGLFVVSDHEREQWAGTVLAYYLPKWRIFNQRVAFFLRADNNLYQTVASRLLKFRYFDIYHDMQTNLDELNIYKPTILVAPPSVLVAIALAAQNGILELDLQRVISVAEVLTDADERFIKSKLGQDVIHQIYQCTEGFLAYTCNYGVLHLKEDSVYFEREYVDEVRFIPIVTDFRRKSQPIVRYRLNDILVSRGNCKCGSVFSPLHRIEGREGDILLFKTRDQSTIRVFADMVSRCMIYASGYSEYKVTQTDYDHLDVYLDTITPEAKQTVVREFTRLSKRLGFLPPAITFKSYQHEYTKKLRRIERLFDA